MPRRTTRRAGDVCVAPGTAAQRSAGNDDHIQWANIGKLEYPDKPWYIILPDNTVRVSLEIVLYVGMLFFLFNEFRELYSIFDATGSVLGYFTDFWNVIDWFLILLSFGAFAMRLYFVLMPAVRDFRPYSEEYQEITAATTQAPPPKAIDQGKLSCVRSIGGGLS